MEQLFHLIQLNGRYAGLYVLPQPHINGHYMAEKDSALQPAAGVQKLKPGRKLTTQGSPQDQGFVGGTAELTV